MWKNHNGRQTLILFGQVVCHVEQNKDDKWHVAYDNTLKLWPTNQYYGSISEVKKYAEETLYRWMEACLEER